jgi:acyl-CoA thioester hydrolase
MTETCRVKPPSIPLEKIVALGDIIAPYRVTVPPEYEDENGHMNMRYYVALFDEAGYGLVAAAGLTVEYHRAQQTGGFDLEHHVHYLNEVGIGDTVAVYSRVVARTAKRVHYLMFMVNESRDKLAAIFECVNAFADLSVRKTAPYPPEIAAALDGLVARYAALDWDAPVCGVMGA